MCQSPTQHLLSTIRELLKVLKSQPHILPPRGKNKFYLECDCKLFHWYKICQHVLPVSVDIGISFEYSTEVKKKVCFEYLTEVKKKCARVKVL